MVTYYVLIVLLIIGYFFTYRIKKTCLFFPYAFFLLIVVSGLRGNIGLDYNAYYSAFEQMKKGIGLSQFEPGYTLIELLFTKLNFPFQALILFTSILVQYFVIRSISRMSKAPLISVLAYIMIGYFYASMNQIRMYIAISISCYSLTLLHFRFKYFILIIIACLFHYSALIMIPMYWLLKYNINSAQIITIIVLLFSSIFMVDLLIEIGIRIFPKYAYYLNSEFFDGYGIQSLHRPLFAVVPLLIYRKQLLSKESRNLIYINCGVYGFVLSLFQLQFQLAERFAIYMLLPAFIIGWPQIVSSNNNKNNRMAVSLCMFLFFGVYNFYLAVNNWMGVINYVPFWLP